MRTIHKSKIKSGSLSKLKKELDTVFSLYIRHKYSKNGYCQCITCDSILPIKRIQNGHFITRKYLATRWDEMNCRPQCYGCNVRGKGMAQDFEDALVAEYGRDDIDALKASRKMTFTPTPAWYTSVIGNYKELLKQYVQMPGRRVR